ncbi:MAG: Sapep family Mn(2+)-dependent dipeptidase [Clostridia bacterium]|nr:Sapep family Mn(2+)-dependent dipeptidase [Clostridia bacterium]
MDSLFEKTVNSISEIIKFNSAQSAPEKGMPFGKGCADCLDYFLSLARSFGFETVNYDNYAGEVIFGDGEDFAILAHLDVVPAGSGWAHAPFGGEIDLVNKRIWGRGAMDDKGPAVISLYCMKQLKDEGFKPKKRIRLIVGCNEESGWECIKYFKAHSTMPETGFSPDADFPVIYAEKGIMHIKLTFPTNRDLTSLKGGNAANMVCDECVVKADIDKAKLKQLNLTAENGLIISRGKSAHGSTPEQGINAIAPILKYLGLDDVYEKLFVKKFGLTELEDETGRLTFSPDVIRGEKNCVTVVCDIRYPATISRERVLEALKGEKYEILSEQAPLFNNKQCELIQVLCGAYNEVTGKKTKPIAIGGGTYARALKCGAAFGPEEEGEENVIHQPNEYITFEKIEKCLKIYKLAIERLTNK